MDGGQRPAVAGVERLEQIGGLAAPDLADDDVVGPVAQRVPHQVADRDGGLGADSPGLEAEAVGALDPEFERVLDGDDPLVFGQQLDQRVEERRLARARASGDQDVPAGQEGRPGGAEHLLGKGALADEVFGRERTAPEPAYGDGDLGTRGRRADGDPRAVLETGIEDGSGGGIEAKRPGDVDRGAVEPGGGESPRLVGLESAASLDPDVAGSVDHDLGDLRVLEERLQARKERLQVRDPAGALHSRPSSRSRQ